MLRELVFLSEACSNPVADIFIAWQSRGMSEAAAGGWRKLLAINGSKNWAVIGERLLHSPAFEKKWLEPSRFSFPGWGGVILHTVQHTCLVVREEMKAEFMQLDLLEKLNAFL